MADIANLTGLSVRGNQDISAADIEHLTKPTTQGALPASLAPLPTSAQHEIVGSTSKTSESLRLETRGKLTSTGNQHRHVSKVLERLSQSAQGHPFAKIEAQMTAVLKPYLDSMNRILSELTHGRT
jgi:hypothetical protein